MSGDANIAMISLTDQERVRPAMICERECSVVRLATGWVWGLYRTAVMTDVY